MAADAVDPLGRLIAERECERLVIDFVCRLDMGEPGSVAELFTPDGVWEWPAGNRRVEGRDALRRYFRSRPPDRLSRRLMTNILVTLTSATTATATSYLTTYRVDGYQGGMVPPRLPVNIGHYEDTFRKIDSTWLLARRVTILPFGGDTERLPEAQHPAPQPQGRKPPGAPES
jgi:SnoaL-like protein